MSSGSGDRLKKVADKLFDGNQSEMARTMGMTPQSANKYFQGDREPGIKILKRLVSIGINASWVIAGIPPMLINDIKQANVSKINMAAEPERKDYFAHINTEDLSDAEVHLLEEVKHFSAFLENRETLRPQVKRLLLELLIQSIDQAIEQPPHDPDDN